MNLNCHDCVIRGLKTDEDDRMVVSIFVISIKYKNTASKLKTNQNDKDSNRMFWRCCGLREVYVDGGPRKQTTTLLGISC